MLELKFIRDNPDRVRKAIADKGEKADLPALLAADREKRELGVKADALRQKRKERSKQIGVLKKKGEDVTEIMASVTAMADELASLEAAEKTVGKTLQDLHLAIPNIPDDAVPVGKNEADNPEVAQVGDVPTFEFAPKHHYDIGEDLGILDAAAGAKITGARFTLYRGPAARLERALINFFLDLHTTEHGYTEIFPPILANRESMVGTGQIPKLENDMFRCVEPSDWYLIPTAEVPLTNIHRDEILAEADLPICYAAYTPCFRREAGSYGKDTRGLIRQHQFNKVEMMKYTTAGQSDDALESLLDNACEVLRRLGLTYRVVLLCTGDMSFASAKTYDVEVWFPAQNRYREISSCTNFRDFQARRAGIRYRPSGGGKARYAHTINGSGLAAGRTTAAIFENYQNADGTVTVPEVLRSYMGGMSVIA